MKDNTEMNFLKNMNNIHAYFQNDYENAVA